MGVDATDERRRTGDGPAPVIDRVEATARGLAVDFDTGRSHSFNRFWLRDNCPSNGDRSSLFRPFSVADLDDDLSVVDVVLAGTRGSVEVVFSDGAVDIFTASFLHRHAVGDDVADVSPRSSGIDDPVCLDATDLVDSDGQHRLLEAVCTSGFAVVGGLDAVQGIEQLATLLGPIRETDFGRIFEIITEPDPFTPSQSASALDPHTDDPYRYSPAGMSILQCVAPCSGVGGASTIVDGFAIAESIANDDPEAFELLATVPVPYEHRRAAAVQQGAAIHLRAEAPVIAVDSGGSVCGVRFHERSMATLQLSPETTERFYRALMIFARAVRSGRFTFTHRLRSGEAIVYDNQRVLHGRTEIVGETRRHLRLCTIDRDQVHSRLRILRERHAPGTECEPLPAGSLS